jgi:hypothetical protein
MDDIVLIPAVKRDRRREEAMMNKNAMRASLYAASLLGLVCWTSSPVKSQDRPGLMVPTAPPDGQKTYPGQRPRPYPRLTGPQTMNPGDWPQHWPYTDEYDSVAAASAVHHLRFVDAKVRFVEVAYFPGVHGQMHGHPFASVFAIDAPSPKSVNERLDPDRSPKIGHGDAPDGMAWPACNTMGPETPHAESNLDTWPHHFYRLEYVRVDGTGIQQNWKTWYPRMLDPPIPVRPMRISAASRTSSAKWPYAPELDSIRAAPNNYKLLFEDDHLRLIEVTLRPGETEPVHTDPYPAVLALDAISGGPPPTDRIVDPKSPFNGKGGHTGGPPPAFESPSCATSAPRAPHAMHNGGSTPLHYYRIEFKRIDGDGLKDNWRAWYPWMGRLTDAYAKTPYAPNY